MDKMTYIKKVNAMCESQHLQMAKEILKTYKPSIYTDGNFYAISHKVNNAEVKLTFTTHVNALSFTTPVNGIIPLLKAKLTYYYIEDNRKYVCGEFDVINLTNKVIVY